MVGRQLMLVHHSEPVNSVFLVRSTPMALGVSEIDQSEWLFTLANQCTRRKLKVMRASTDKVKRFVALRVCGPFHKSEFCVKLLKNSEKRVDFHLFS